ncbi:hypothetical protein MPSEU_000373400 [Mayamaea pseudoterrestris]|nr:hypothetical protein MPSEU_000373400 [Mayamaea pseudoterrestris]
MTDADVQSRFFDHVDQRRQLYIDRLAEAVAIPSISADPGHLNDIVRMMEWTTAEIRKLGGFVKLQPNPAATDKRSLPPILMAEWAKNPNKKTLCVYGHLDVQPADKEDGWETDPFVLTEKNGKLYGRGSTDDKGPALSWLWVIEAHQELGIDLPVNIKLLFEGMEEFGSDGLFETIHEEAKNDGFLCDVDFFCISDNYWIGKHKPCLTYGLRGMAYFELAVQGCEQDLHSGVLGGTVHEAMTDLVKVMSTLVDSHGNILVKGIMDEVKHVTPEEEAFYDSIDFNLDEYAAENRITSGKLLHDDKKTLLMSRWRFPTLSIHGIQGAFSGIGACHSSESDWQVLASACPGPRRQQD